jgi:hypothetical protein
MDDIPLSRAPELVRIAAMRAVDAQHVAGRSATVSRVTAEKTRTAGWRYVATITSRSQFGGSKSETVQLHSLEAPRPVSHADRMRRASELAARTQQPQRSRMTTDEARARIARLKPIRSESRSTTYAPTRQRQVLRAGLRGQAGNTTPEHTAAEWDALLRQTRAFL